ncbi:MAG: NADH:ubiquinone reductase (Na(+)-transporting) subunit B [Myxococcota bacterium]|nr:NADH:ubiquinone reductase (Na(+)-transporting) subunit B [Myxococcota bacterium]
MQFLRNALDKVAPHFEEGGKFHKLHPVYEMPDTILFTPGTVTKKGAHIRDALDLKRMMITVVLALQPVILMAQWNTGFQALSAISEGAPVRDDFQMAIFQALFGDVSLATAGDLSASVVACFVLGLIYFVPIFLVTQAAGGVAEVAFSVVRKHEVNEGFLVSGMLFPLILPPTIPLWQVALGIMFGVVVGKEMFGGTGMNVLNVALTGRAFLFFAYPAQISGDKVWQAVGADGYSGATWLGKAAAADPATVAYNGIDNAVMGEGAGMTLSWMDAFLGMIPGSMGETSALACLLGAGVLIATRIGAWETMLGVVVGTALTALGLNAIGSDSNAMFAMPFWWHMVLGGWAFGMVFMATDPVTSAFTSKGKLIYGAFIGILVVLVRVVNPAYPEGMMLAILFMNLFAPLIDHFMVQANIKRRAARHAA